MEHKGNKCQPKCSLNQNFVRFDRIQQPGDCYVLHVRAGLNIKKERERGKKYNRVWLFSYLVCHYFLTECERMLERALHKIFLPEKHVLQLKYFSLWKVLSEKKNLCTCSCMCSWTTSKFKFKFRKNICKIQWSLEMDFFGEWKSLYSSKSCIIRQGQLQEWTEHSHTDLKPGEIIKKSFQHHFNILKVV